MQTPRGQPYRPCRHRWAQKQKVQARRANERQARRPRGHDAPEAKDQAGAHAGRPLSHGAGEGAQEEPAAVQVLLQQDCVIINVVPAGPSGQSATASPIPDCSL